MKEENADEVSMRRAKQVLQIHRAVDDFKAQHYIPFDRQGRYFLGVYDKETGELKHWIMDNSLRKLKEKSLELRKQFPKDEIRIGENYKSIIREHSSLPPSTIAYIRMIIEDLKKTGAIPESVENIDAELRQIMSKWGVKFPSHLIKAKMIPGWSRDYDRSIARYVTSLSGWTAHMRYDPLIRDALGKLDAVKDAPLIDYIQKLHNYSRMNRKYASGISRALFAYYLAGNPKSFIINAMQPLTTTLPYSTRYLSTPEALKVFSQACKLTSEYLIRKKLGKELPKGFDPELVSLLNEMYEKGELSARAMEAYLGLETPKMNKAIQILGTGFRLAEEFNRVHATVTSYLIGKKKGLKAADLESFSRRFIGDTQYEYGQIYRPLIAQHPLAAPFFTFRTFQYNWMRVMKNLLAKGEYSTFLRMLVPLLIIGGIRGIPFVKELLDATEAVTGVDVLEELRKAEGEEPSVASDLITYGLPTFFDITVAASLNPVELPDIEARGLMQAVGRMAFGVIGDLPDRAERAWRMASRYGDTYRAVESIMPEFIRNVMVALRWYHEKGALMPGGERAFTPRLHEIILKGMGIQPLGYIKRFVALEKIREIEDNIKDETRYVNFKIAKALYKYMLDPKNVTELTTVLENVMAKNVQYAEKGETHRIVIPDENAIKTYVLKMVVPDLYEVLHAPKKARPEVIEKLNTWSGALQIAPEKIVPEIVEEGEEEEE